MITMKDYNIVQTGHRQGLTVSAIAVKYSKDRKTVRKYLRMDNDQFNQYLERMAERGKVFSVYKDEILEIYQKNQEGRTVYSSSVHDYLREKYGELPGSDRTLRNYLTYLKASGAIKAGLCREYRPVEPLAYGKQAQVDFGVETTNIGKAWFVVVVLSRSRYRYVAAQSRPFTSDDVIGHLLDAFEFFGGITEELVMDQDRTMIVAENLGDLTTTKAFAECFKSSEIPGKRHLCFPENATGNSRLSPSGFLPWMDHSGSSGLLPVAAITSHHATFFRTWRVAQSF